MQGTPVRSGQGHTALPVRVPTTCARSLVRRRAAVLAVLAVLAALPPLARAQGPRWQVGGSPSFLSGRYGGDTPTEVVYTPLIARRLFADGDLTLVLPYTCIRGGAGVTVIDGSPVRTGEAHTDPTRNPTPERPTNERQQRVGTSPPASIEAPPGPAPPVPSEAPATVCGLGDVVVRGRYYVADQRGWLPTIALRAHIKAPTASAARRLGTGRADEGVGVEVSRTLGSRLLVMVDGGYTLIGQPEDREFNDIWWYDVGLSHNLVRGALDASVFFEEYRSIVPGFSNARDILAVVSYRHPAGWRLQVATQFGLSDGAPDHGLTVGASRRF